MINVGNVITLSNGNDYVISGITYKDDYTYLYLVNPNMKEIKIVYLDNDEVVEIEDKNKIEEIINLFVKDFLNNQST